jgi:hypothetical protein
MKILGIGLGRTGTRSLYKALQILGYKAKHSPEIFLDADGELHVNPSDIEQYDALTDNAVVLIYKKLDQQYPGSKFILTIREMDSWLASVENNSRAMAPWWADKPHVPALHRTLFGTETFDRKKYADAYRHHESEVREYFSGRETDLLILDICSGEGWEKLCPFLGKPIPTVPFPKTNVFGVSDWATIAKREGIQPLGRGDAVTRAPHP